MDSILNILKGAGILLLVLLIFNFVILVHEWGHFLAARWRKLEIEAFQIWMGKPIWSRTWNGVQYGLGWLPIGGFVKLPQMSPMEAIEGGNRNERTALPPIKPIDKIIVAFAGPLFSFLLALAFATVVSLYGRPESAAERTTVIGFLAPDSPGAKSGLLKAGDEIMEINGHPIKKFLGMKDSVVSNVAFSDVDDIVMKVRREGVPEPLQFTVNAPLDQNPEWRTYQEKSWWDRIFSRPPMRKIGLAPKMDLFVAGALPGSPAERAGLQKGDIITAVNGVKTYSVSLDIAEAIHQALPKDAALAADRTRTIPPITLTVQRGDKSMDVSLTPAYPLTPSGFEQPIVGITYDMKDEFVMSMKGDNPLGICRDFLLNTVDTLKALVQKNTAINAGHMSGPVGIVNVYYNLFQHPHWMLMIVWFSVMLNCGLAFFNMLPIPVLDGGHITMALYEMIRGKALPLKVLEFATNICVIFLLGFMLFVTMKDVGGLVSGGDKDEKITFGPPAAAAGTPAPAAPAGN